MRMEAIKFICSFGIKELFRMKKGRRRVVNIYSGAMLMFLIYFPLSLNPLSLYFYVYDTVLKRGGITK